MRSETLGGGNRRLSTCSALPVSLLGCIYRLVWLRYMALLSGLSCCVSCCAVCSECVQDTVQFRASSSLYVLGSGCTQEDGRCFVFERQCKPGVVSGRICIHTYMLLCCAWDCTCFHEADAATCAAVACLSANH